MKQNRYNRLILFVGGMLLTATAVAQKQPVEELLQKIEQNNTTLHALRCAIEAEKLENRTDIFLEDPQVGFTYLWGSNVPGESKREFTASQSVDLATLLGRKRQVAQHQNQLLEWQYRADRMAILLEAKEHAIELIYCNALLHQLQKREQHTRTIFEGEQQRLERGDGTQLELNNAQLDWATIKAQLLETEMAQKQRTLQLARLNGGIEPTLLADSYPDALLPADFEQWFVEAEVKNPVLSYVRQEVELGKRQVQLARSMSLPTFSAGYIDEKEVGERFQGITVGFSVPLWSNRNRTKQARAEVIAAQSRQQDATQQFYSQLHLQYQRALSLGGTAALYRQSLEGANNTKLLKKSFDAGQLSLLQYHVELSRYYDVVVLALQAERDYQLALAQLWAVML